MEYRSLAERQESGRAARDRAPWASHAEWAEAPDRTDPLDAIEADDEGRIEALVPIRHARMLATPFTFYRGSASVMAADLASTPTGGIDVQLCGDAHLSNFGIFASPARRMVFDVNDFDETLPGPWEWDVKRLVTSFVIAGRNNGFGEKTSRKIARRSVHAYERAMHEFAQMSTLEVWYTRLLAKDLRSLVTKTKGKKQVDKTLAKARRRNSMHALSKLAVEVDGRFEIAADPPIVVPLRDALDLMDPDRAAESVRNAFDGYLASTSESVRALLSRFRLVDIAHKVVGVGSVGTRCFIMLFEGRDHGDPLFLQGKEAGASVLESHLPPSRFSHGGQRIVEGQLLMQAASDILLGWTTGTSGRDFYFRQLRDMKGSADVEAQDASQMSAYADLCGWTLARAHARSGDPVVIDAYLGEGKEFRSAVAQFALRYADRNDLDHQQLAQAVADGRLEVSAER